MSNSGTSDYSSFLGSSCLLKLRCLRGTLALVRLLCLCSSQFSFLSDFSVSLYFLSSLLVACRSCCSFLMIECSCEMD
jgi:hypothetical protein